MSLILTPPDSGEAPVSFEEAVARVAVELPDFLPRQAEHIMVALDVDGTLLLPHGASEHVVENVRAALDAGMTLVIASGRGIEAVRPVLNHVKLESAWAVTSNGATLVRYSANEPGGVRVIKRHTFDPAETIDRLLERFPDVYIGVEVPEGFFVDRPFPGCVFFEPTWQRSVEELRTVETTRVVAMVDGMDVRDFDAALTEIGIGDIAQFAVGWTTWVDIGPKGVTKATGLQDLEDELGIPHEGTVAVGDGLNDIEMLEWAAHGVAMGSGLPQVKAAANAVTTTVENEGSAAVLRALLKYVGKDKVNSL